MKKSTAKLELKGTVTTDTSRIRKTKPMLQNVNEFLHPQKSAFAVKMKCKIQRVKNKIKLNYEPIKDYVLIEKSDISGK